MAAADDGALELDLLAASLRRDAADLTTFLESLAAKLEEAVPGLVRVERARQGMFGPKAVRRIEIEAGSERLALGRPARGDRLEASRGKVSGGIVLKSEPVGIDGWLAALTEALAAEAQSNERTRQALERLLLA
jgi:hypothetical protein